MKLIILDYRNGVVSVLSSQKDIEAQVIEWCNDNQTSIDDCNWMTWNGHIGYEK